MPSNQHPIEQLESMAGEYRHLLGERARAGRESSAFRRNDERLQEVQQRYDNLLHHWIDDPDARGDWQRFLAEGETPPEDPLPRTPPAFVGLSDDGDRLELRDAGNDEYDFTVNAKHVNRLGRGLSLDHGPNGRVYMQGREWREIAESPDEALRALQAYVSGGGKAPPWEHARALFADGLIDVHFGLTGRGKRIMAARAS